MRSGIGRKLSLVVVAVGLAVPASANAAHFLMDHPAPGFAPPAGLPSSTVNSGGEGAEWELVDTITSGNPHSDLDFFTQGGNTYVSVGTLAAGVNGGGQTIVQLTQGDEVAPQFISAHPSASCLSTGTTGLQHDVEAAPKGNAILNTTNPYAVRTDTQLLIDASDAAGRCHDQGLLGIQNAPRGGLELVDVTDVANPVEIGLTSHAGQAHTVNVDPKRPHIAYVSTSDAVTVTDGVRQNEVAGADANDLDGFEVVDYSSCMNFAAGITVDAKRTSCLPQVYRYRFPTVEMALGHTIQDGGSAIFGCHELEVYPDDRLTCGSGSALIALDMSGAFDDMGTPTDYSDDRPRGTPLPCQIRPSSSEAPFTTDAQVTDCVDGTGTGATDLNVPNWLAAGAPSLTGVTYLGSIHHQGGGPGQGSIPPLDSTEDLAFNHEAELSGSGKSLIATDERGGGLFPPGATCSPVGDNLDGNGGVHFYKTSALSTTGPGEPEDAQKAYALTPEGDKAIFRAPIRTQARGTVCTSHVFQQIPGENRIFMAWYSQGTQVIDFVENPDGTVRFASAGYFIPENANEWVSAVFKTEQHNDGTSTYYGATGDFALGEAGRNSIDVYKVTLPPAPLAAPPGGGGGGDDGGGGGAPGACVQPIAGSKANDQLLGSIAGDRIKGRGGNDRLDGRDGDDCVNGGGGRDRLRGSAGADQLVGGRGTDRLNGGEGDDRLRSKKGGRDRVTCGAGDDVAIVDDRDRVRGCERVKIRRT